MARGRRVHRVVRKIDPWSVLKLSVLFFISMVIVVLIGSVILWSVAQSSGAVGKLEKFATDLGFTDFRFRGGQIFKLAIFGGLVFVVAGTVFVTILAFLYNLISDLVGGIEVQVIEEEMVVPGDNGRTRQAGKAPKAAKAARGNRPQSEAQVGRRTVV